MTAQEARKMTDESRKTLSDYLKKLIQKAAMERLDQIEVLETNLSVFDKDILKELGYVISQIQKETYFGVNGQGKDIFIPYFTNIISW